MFVVAATYWTVLVAELVGDKCIYTVASLSVRLRRAPLLSAMALAFGGKMLAAVLLGRVIVQLPHRWTSLGSAIAFFAIGAAVWLKDRPGYEVRGEADPRPVRAAAAAFAALFLTEWADAGQIAAIALVLQSQQPAAVWVGGTLAMMTKGIGALAVGTAMRDRVPDGVLRAAAAVSCCAFGVLAVLNAL